MARFLLNPQHIQVVMNITEFVESRIKELNEFKTWWETEKANAQKQLELIEDVENSWPDDMGGAEWDEQLIHFAWSQDQEEDNNGTRHREAGEGKPPDQTSIDDNIFRGKEAD